MKCPRCGSTMREVICTMTSGLSDLDETGGLIKGLSCEPAGCGHWIDYVVEPVKPLPKVDDVTRRYQERMANFVDRLASGEPTLDAIKRCNEFFNRQKTHIKTQLMKGNTFNLIHKELAAKHKDTPSRSWLRKTYKAWAEKEITV